MKLQAVFWLNQHRLKEARSETLYAVEGFEKLGAMKDVEECRKLLQQINEEMNSLVISEI